MILTAMIGTYSYDQRVQDFATLIIAAGIFLAVLVLYRRKRS